MATRLDAAAGFEDRKAVLLGSERNGALDVREPVAEIIRAVRQRGDRALIEYTETFDRYRATGETLKISAPEIERAVAAVPADQLAALDMAARRIRAFHAQRPQGSDTTDAEGLRLGARWTAIDAVGLYVPGGTASYPSSVLMNAIPAKAAGVARLVMVVPTPNGVLNPLVLAAAGLAGVDEIYRIGGAQAIAALAYGTETIKPVDKIVGPGNAWVAEAKRQVFGVVGIDMIAGPSEILVVADGANDPDWIAADLLSQAEHDSDAQSILITDDAGFADRVEAAVGRQLADLPRAAIAGESWKRHGVVIVVKDLAAEAPDLINLAAPEHLELAVDNPAALMAEVRHAGSIFLGRHTPEALGDYVAGPNHVLPTSRSARFSSGLNVLDFMKRSTFIACPPAGLRAIGPAAVTLARAEGLEAHALSVEKRLKDRDGAP
ncbi:MAG: histidinol dehydrogenase [Rhodospirillaceae bacterium]